MAASKGEWYECDDGVFRPVVRGEILNSSNDWAAVLLLVDTGADCTVLNAPILDRIGFSALGQHRQLGGIGGDADSVEVTTQIRLTCDNGSAAVFRGTYAAFMQLKSLDMSVLGRDILGLFAVVVDRPGNVVALIGQNHSYSIHAR